MLLSWSEGKLWAWTIGGWAVGLSVMMMGGGGGVVVVGGVTLLVWQPKSSSAPHTDVPSGSRMKHSAATIIIMYIYHALINALSAHMIHINLNMIFYTHVEHSPTKTIYIKYYKK